MTAPAKQNKISRGIALVAVSILGALWSYQQKRQTVSSLPFEF
jgi:hypothetical protein